MPPSHSVTPHVPVPTRDGTVLSAAVHWPQGAPEDGQKYPALIEYHPYRKDDRSAVRASDHDYFAEQGYVSIRLDVRGSGSSQGVNTDEYMLVETSDGYDAVEWAASQPWCSGNVGMFGSSYGGFTSYQVAMLRPPHLKAIVPIYATDDRYTDDCHYKGGAFKAYYDTGTYGTMMISINALPPDLDLFGPGWEKEWEQRLEKNTPYMLHWLAQQTDGPYWRPGSLRGKYESVQAATFIIGGWQDGYPNPPLRAFSRLQCQKKALVGPWNHSRPDVAIPGPNIDYLHEMRRWFDLHLKGVDDGISAEPPVTYYMQQFDRPVPTRKATTGYWRSELGWPAQGSSERTFYLAGADRFGARALSEKPVVSENVASLETDPLTGLTGGLWSGGLPFGLASDQRQDEALSLTFTSSPLAESLPIAGNPKLSVTVSASAPVAMVVAKLADVAPDGSSALVTRGILNITRRNGMDTPEAAVPHEPYRLEIELDATAWELQRGHRLRLSISGSDFPNSWPTPLPATLGIHTGGSEQAELRLPTVGEPVTKPPQYMPPPKRERLPSRAEPDVWNVTEDRLTGTMTLHIRRAGETEVREGVKILSSDELKLSASRDDPASVHADGTSTSKLAHGGSIFESVARQQIRSDAEHFHWQVDLEVKRDDQVKAEKTWSKSFRRNLL